MKCKVEKRQGGFAVYPVEEPQVRETLVQGGVATVTLRPVSQVIPGYQTDLFKVWYRGDNQWDADRNCGFQRQWCSWSSQKVRAMLKKCGFTTPEIREIVQTAKGSQK
jgi:hypothetical protein